MSKKTIVVNAVPQAPVSLAQAKKAAPTAVVVTQVITEYFPSTGSSRTQVIVDDGA